jgi:hypothetical protein
MRRYIDEAREVKGEKKAILWVENSKVSSCGKEDRRTLHGTTFATER